MMHLKRKGTRGRKQMIGILYGARNNSLTKYMRKDCSLINAWTISGIFMSCVGKTIWLKIWRSTKRIYNDKASKQKHKATIFTRRPMCCHHSTSFSQTNSKNIKQSTRKRMYGSWNLRANRKVRAYSWSTNSHRSRNGRAIP